MKKILFFIGIICAGIIATWSCSSDEKSITEEPQEGTTSLEFGLDLQSLGTKANGADRICISESEMYNKLIADKDALKAIVTLSKTNTQGTLNFYQDKIFALRPVTIGGVNRIVTEAIVVPFENGASYQLVSMKIVDGSNPTLIYYGTILEKSSLYQEQDKFLKECVGNNKSQIIPKLYDKVYHSVCLHCLENYTPDQFGLSLLTPDTYVKHYCVPFIVDICDPQTGKDLLGHGTYEIYRGVVTGVNIRPTTWQLIKTGSYGKWYINRVDDSRVGQLGEICFFDDPRIDNSKEWYSIKLRNRAFPLGGNGVDYFIETVPYCNKQPGVENDSYVGRYRSGEIKGVPLNAMLTLLDSDNTHDYFNPGFINDKNVIHFWWCQAIANECAPNKFYWPTDPTPENLNLNPINPDNDNDLFSWYDYDEPSAQ